jgi:hypothetical protein
MSETLDLFKAALGLAEPWRVTHSDLDVVQGRPDLYLDFPRGARFGCSVAGCEQGSCPVHDTEAKTWRQMDFFQYKAFLHARVPDQQGAAGGHEFAHPGRGGQSPRLPQQNQDDHHHLPHRGEAPQPVTLRSPPDLAMSRSWARMVNRGWTLGSTAALDSVPRLACPVTPGCGAAGGRATLPACRAGGLYRCALWHLMRRRKGSTGALIPQRSSHYCPNSVA